MVALQRISTTVAILFLFSFLLGLPAEAGLGPVGGASFSDFSFESVDSLDSDFSSRNGIAAGLVLEGEGEPWRIRLEPMYVQKRVEKEIVDLEFGQVLSDLDLDYVEVPILFSYRMPVPWITPYVLGGISAGWLLDAKETFADPEYAPFFERENLKDELEHFDLGYTFGGGVAIPFGSLELFGEARWGRGLTELDNNLGIKNEGFLALGGLVFEIGGDGDEVKDDDQAPQEQPATRERESTEPDTTKYPEGYDPPGEKDDEPPKIYGEVLDECPLDIDIHVPAAQNRAMPVIAEALDATVGAYTLRNRDIEPEGEALLATRLVDRGKLLKVKGKPDYSVKGAIPGEDDLVQIDLLNPSKLDPVFLNAYAVAAESGKDKVARRRGWESVGGVKGKIRIWKNADRSGGPITLPHKMKGQSETLYVEGIKAGRYRLVLLYKNQLTVAKARAIKGKEMADPHATPANGFFDLKKRPTCWRNVRLTVAITDIYQKLAREHVYDLLWGGRAVIDGRVWPPGGKFAWGNADGLAGTWIDGKVWGEKVESKGTAPGKSIDKIEKIHGAFVPQVQQVVQGTAEYGPRLQLNYSAERISFVRKEPVTVMVPDHVTLTPGRGLTPYNQVRWGRTYKVSLQAAYQLFDQHDRHLEGNKARFERQYGTRLRMYEALGMGTNAAETNDAVQMNYASTSPLPLVARDRRFTLPIGTKQRSNAIPKKGSLADGNFKDTFTMSISRKFRGVLQQDILDGNLRAGTTLFSVRQDIVALLQNGVAEYDVRVARGQLLDIRGPQPRATTGGSWGGIGFRMVLGGANGTDLDTGNPDRVGPNHNP